MRIELRDARVTVRGRFHADGSVLRETVSSGSAFDVDLAIEADAPDETLEKLVRVAHRGCFAEASLLQPIELHRTDTINGKRVTRP